MDIMDLALKYKDFEWAKELPGALDLSETSKNAPEEKVLSEIFINEDIALEDIFNTYGIKEEGGIRSFNIRSEFDRNNSELVIIEKNSYKKGEIVRYKIPTNSELLYIRGMVNGYIMGYGEANNTINQQMIQLYSSIAESGHKPPTTNGDKPKKGPKKKIPDEPK